MSLMVSLVRVSYFLQVLGNAALAFCSFQSRWAKQGSLGSSIASSKKRVVCELLVSFNQVTSLMLGHVKAGMCVLASFQNEWFKVSARPKRTVLE